MNSLIRKILCVVMSLTLITGIFAGCSRNDTQWYIANDISLKTQYGSLPDQGTVGDIEYRILPKESFGCMRAAKIFLSPCLQMSGAFSG